MSVDLPTLNKYKYNTIFFFFGDSSGRKHDMTFRFFFFETVQEKTREKEKERKETEIRRKIG